MIIHLNFSSQLTLVPVVEAIEDGLSEIFVESFCVQNFVLKKFQNGGRTEKMSIRRSRRIQQLLPDGVREVEVLHCGSKQGDIETLNNTFSYDLKSEQSKRASERMSAAEHASKASRAEQAKDTDARYKDKVMVE